MTVARNASTGWRPHRMQALPERFAAPFLVELRQESPIEERVGAPVGAGPAGVAEAALLPTLRGRQARAAHFAAGDLLQHALEMRAILLAGRPVGDQ